MLALFDHNLKIGDLPNVSKSLLCLSLTLDPKRIWEDDLYKSCHLVVYLDDMPRVGFV